MVCAAFKSPASIGMTKVRVALVLISQSQKPGLFSSIHDVEKLGELLALLANPSSPQPRSRE